MPRDFLALNPVVTVWQPRAASGQGCVPPQCRGVGSVMFCRDGSGTGLVLVLGVVSPLQTQLCLVGSSQSPGGLALVGHLPSPSMLWLLEQAGGQQVWGEGPAGAFAEL